MHACNLYIYIYIYIYIRPIYKTLGLIDSIVVWTVAFFLYSINMFYLHVIIGDEVVENNEGRQLMLPQHRIA